MRLLGYVGAAVIGVAVGYAALDLGVEWRRRRRGEVGGPGWRRGPIEPRRGR